MIVSNRIKNKKQNCLVKTKKYSIYNYSNNLNYSFNYVYIILCVNKWKNVLLKVGWWKEKPMA